LLGRHPPPPPRAPPPPPRREAGHAGADHCDVDPFHFVKGLASCNSTPTAADC
jgi:hypothetical protein